MKLKLNLKKWNEARLETEAKIRTIKEALHTPGHMGTTTEWLDLFGLQMAATTLYMLRAETRGEGRLHCRQEIVYRAGPEGTTLREVVPVTREQQKKRIAGFLPAQDCQLDENGEIGFFCACKEPIATITVPA